MQETPSPSGKLIVGHDGPVTTITLNRPKVHNALDQELSAELNTAVKAVSVDRDCRVLVIQGAGETFCAGDDIKGFQNFGPGDGPWEIRMYQETANIIYNLVPVTIAAVDGVCTGRLTKFAGRRKTLEWNLIGALFSAEKAERYDLVNRLCEPDALDDEVAALTKVLLARSPETTATTKYFVKNAADLDMAKTLVFEGAPQRSRSPQGIKDFAETESRNERRKVATSFWQD